MSRIPSSYSPVQKPIGESRTGGDFQDVNLDQFLNLLLTEMQNQDPLSPMENSEILQQVSQIREIAATDELRRTLGAVATGQNLSTASSLIGRRISALDDAGEAVEGVVDRVSVETPEGDDSQRILRVHVGGHRIDLKNIRAILDRA